jgi:hypothetical protein
MHDPMTFEAHRAGAYGRYADGADADVAALDLAAAIATGSGRDRLPCHGLSGSWAVRCAPQWYFPCLQWIPEVSQ